MQQNYNKNLHSAGDSAGNSSSGLTKYAGSKLQS